MSIPEIKSQEIGIIGKIIIPKEIESMIDFLHKSVGATEWSGILFYKMVGGDINTLSNLEFKCEFLYPMNIGSHSYTEFDYSGEVMNAYDLREDLIECATSMIHTHHSMSTFFSGTDTDELLANCVHFNYYISLIVNFSKEYKCKIAFPSKTKNTFEHQIKNSNGELITVTRTVEEECIIIGELAIEFENAIIVPEWLDVRIKNLKVKKATIKPATIITGFTPKTYPVMDKVMQPIRSYTDWDSDWNEPINQTFNKPLVTPKEFLCALINLNGLAKKIGLEGSVLEIETLIDEGELDYDTYDQAISNNVEILHDDVYGNDKMFKSHCELSLQVLENNVQLFSDKTIYNILKENLELYAI